MKQLYVFIFLSVSILMGSSVQASTYSVVNETNRNMSVFFDEYRPGRISIIAGCERDDTVYSCLHEKKTTMSFDLGPYQTSKYTNNNHYVTKISLEHV